MIQSLIARGVVCPHPQSVEIDSNVNTERIASGAILHAGTRIRGADTLICADAEIGKEAPACIENCYVGPEVSLKGGYFNGSIFLKKSSVASCAHVRAGTILEEHASAAHSAGLKQTILFPFVTLGSLVNFCDCLMCGGTGPENHSEVGSSYIHFNFTPQQDKATPSLIGEVPNGVMLNQAPIFLGGQGGLVGPCRLAFGSVIAAGTICRKDETRQGRLIFGGPSRSGNVAYAGASGGGIRRIVLNNLYYLANLKALEQWYVHVRSLFISGQMPEPLYQGLVQTLAGCIQERIKRLGHFFQKVAPTDLAGCWHRLEPELGKPPKQPGLDEKKEAFTRKIRRRIADLETPDYIHVIRNLEPEDTEAGVCWLKAVVDGCTERWNAILPGLENH